MEEHLIHSEAADRVLKPHGFRMIWSAERMWYLGGQWRPKYSHLAPCWVIEKLCPPEQYGDRLEWAKRDLGPFPTAGDWEFVMAMPGEQAFRDAGEDALQRIITAVRMTAALTMPQKLALHKAEQDAKAKEQKRVLGDVIADARPAIHSRIYEEEPRFTPPALRDQGLRGSYIMQPGDKE